MKKLVIASCSVFMLAAATSAFAGNVKISQVYGGSGSTSGTWKSDYIEIYNSGGTYENISGWTLEYGSSTGVWGGSGGTNFFTFPASTYISPGSYILVQMSTGSGVSTLPVTPDFIASNSTAMSATTGKVALFNTALQNVACGSETVGSIEDKVAYGTAGCAENNASAPAPDATKVEQRGGVPRGSSDTNDNSVDFTAVAASTNLPSNGGAVPVELSMFKTE